jgi:hypothetical protein
MCLLDEIPQYILDTLKAIHDTVLPVIDPSLDNKTEDDLTK